MRVIAYRRVSTQEQAESGAGLGAQRAAIEAEAERRGWHDVEWIADAGYSAASVKRRVGLRSALTRLNRGEADVLLVAKLDRLSRSTIDFATILEQAHKHGWKVVVQDIGVDTSTPNGRLLANILMSIAQWEREMIGLRTREGLAVKKSQGVRLGRASALPRMVKDRIQQERKRGKSLRAIADLLNAEGVPASNGGRWYAASVRGALLSAALDDQATLSHAGA